MKIGLVACSNKKLTESCQAQKLYSPSTLFRFSAAAAKASCDKWAILSSKHGLVMPEDILEPYDETLKGASMAAKKEWARRVRDQLIMTFPGAIFVLFAGKDYAAATEGLPVENPLRGLGIGKRLAKLKRWKN